VTNLVHDTVYHRARLGLTAAAHAADDAIERMTGGGERRRVLFEAASPLSVAVFRPVLERLSRDPRLEFWFTTADRSWDAARTFLREGITDRVVSPKEIYWKKFHGYVNADFWNTTWLPRCARRVHFFHGVAGKYGLDAPMEIAPVVRSFDRVMFANEDRMRRYIDAGVIEPDGSRGQLIGYPKVDCLVDGSLDRCQIQQSLGLDPARPTVLYAPTWSVFSSVNSIGGELPAALSALGVNVLVKLHDRSFDARSRRPGSIDWRAQFASLCAAANAHAVTDGDISRYLAAADLLITDHSSAGFEFMLLDRPIVVINCPELIASARVAPDKVSLLHNASAVVPADTRAIAGAVSAGLAYPMDRSAERRQTAARMFHRPGSATARAVDCIYDLLELPARAAEPAAAASHVSSPAFVSSSRSSHHV
jgi:hypothetical protein